ncbi:MAG: DUF2314 domain-containing protein [Verrucomicrobiales bacterium]
MRQQLKRFPVLSTILLLALVVRLLTSGLSWVGVVALVIATVWFAIELVRWLLAEPDEQPRPFGAAAERDEDSTESLISLVYFLSEERTPDESTIRSCVANSLGIDFDVSDPESEYFVIEFRPPESNQAEDGIRHFMVRIPQGLFAVLVSERPYIENPKSFARETIRDKRLRSAVEEHRAWLSVDLMDDATDPDRTEEAYDVIGKILASMAGPDCLALYCPELQRCNEFDFSLIETLSGGDPLRLFDEPTFEPIIEISDNDPRMAAAVEEAVRRWPEFVEAFRARHEDDSDHYIVKAEFREGKRSEYMWVTVSDIAEDEVTGILMNDPHELLDIHRGASVSFPLDRLNDWIHPGTKDGSHVGGFTLDVLAEDDDGF